MTTYALLVGIDMYQPPVSPLHGCVADVDAFAAILEARIPSGLDVQCLRNAAATREAFIATVREHLGRAGPDDVALLYYAGHGTQEPVPPELEGREGTGTLQSLVLYDAAQSRADGTVVRPLADKELAILLSDVGRAAGHLAVFLDCCHSGDADRDASWRPRAWLADPDRVQPEYRGVTAALGRPRRREEFVGAERADWTRPELRHVLLTACGSDQTAKEQSVDGCTRGVFSHALATAVGLLGPSATYRTLLASVRSRVERAACDQTPELAVRGEGLADGLFLAGTVIPAPHTFRMTPTVTGFAIDAGAIDGFAPPDGDEGFVLECRREGQAPRSPAEGRVRVLDVEPGRSIVEPLGWHPADVAYVAVVVDAPSPRAVVHVGRPPGADAGPTDELRAALTLAISTAGPSGGPSPDLRLATDDGANGPPGFALHVRRVDERIEITRADDTLIAPAIPVGSGAHGFTRAVTQTVGDLVHLARWERIRALGDHPAPDDGRVDLELFPAAAEDAGPRAADLAPYPPAAEYEFTYREGEGDVLAPYVYARLVNRTDRRLYAAVLDLSDRFEVSIVEPAMPLDAGRSFDLAGGRHLSVTLPGDDLDRLGDVQPGDRSREIVLVISSESPFSVDDYALPPLDEPATRGWQLPAAPRPAARWSAYSVALVVSAPQRGRPA